MRKYDNQIASVATILIILCFSLVFSSVVITYFLTQMNNNSCVVPSIGLPLSLSSYSQSQNFANGQFNMSTLARTGSNNWVLVPNVGYQLIISTIQPLNYFYIQNIEPDSSGIIVNNYVINNTGQNWYSIVLSGNGGMSNNEVLVMNDGFHIPNFLFSGVRLGDNDFIPYPNAAKVVNANIQTQFHDCSLYASDCDAYVTFTFNGQPFTSHKVNKDSTISVLGVPLTNSMYYGGLCGYTGGLVFNYFSTLNTIQQTQSNNVLSLISSFVSTMLLIAGWTLPDCALPLTLNLILIKTQLAGIIICLVVILRGATG
jgi:hypothetical protein